ncbi:uncharacterized protein LOC135370552 [Ornithodoros turicata]|uniref:uncharacterized protein LOC135370552 n=1 Tax=Ornithodoros turicata TaxID=34597 RepID=UPI0031395CFC
MPGVRTPSALMCALSSAHSLLLLCLLLTFETVSAIPGRRHKGSGHDKNGNMTCTLEEFNDCMRQLSSITESEELSLASSRRELDTLCKKWKQGYRCMDQHMSNCSDRHKQIIYNDVVHGTRQVMNELCRPGHMQNEYLRHAPCFKSLFVEGGRCSQKYKNMIQMSKASANLSEDVNIEEGLRKTCCTFNEYVHCYYTHMPELCGEEGRNFFTTYSEKMSGPLIHQHCASYTYDSTCNSPPSGTQSNFLQRHYSTTLFHMTLFELIMLSLWKQS